MLSSHQTDMQVENEAKSLQKELEEGLMKVDRDIPPLEYEPRARSCHYYERTPHSTFVLRTTSAPSTVSVKASPLSIPKSPKPEKIVQESNAMEIEDHIQRPQSPIHSPSSSSSSNLSKKLGLIHEDPLKPLVESQCPVCR